MLLQIVSISRIRSWKVLRDPGGDKHWWLRRGVTETKSERRLGSAGGPSRDAQIKQQTNKLTNKQTNKQTTNAYTHTRTHAHKQTHAQTNQHAHKQTNKQTNTQTSETPGL